MTILFRAGDGRVAVLSINHPALHHEIDVRKLRRIIERISQSCHNVSIASRLNGTDAVSGADEISRIARRGEQSFNRRQSTGDHEAELHRMIAFSNVSSVSDFHSGFHRERKVLFRERIVREFFWRSAWSRSSG